MKQNGKTINSYFIFIILLLLVIFGLNLLNNRTDEYTKAEFIADLDAGNVSEVVVQPNGEAPTGYLEIQMKNGVSHKLYATDITELETLVREYGFDPVVNDIERENWFLTYMLPMLVVLAVGIFLFMMMTAVGSYQIITRYFFNRPSTVSEELLTYSFTWMSLLASAYVFGKRDHMRMGFMADKLTGNCRKYLEIIIDLLSFSFAAVVMVYGGCSITKLTMIQTTASLRVPMGYIYVIVPVTGILIMIFSAMYERLSQGAG